MENDTIGSLFVVSAPSGGGKTSLVRQVLQTQTQMAVSISHTTRAKRPGEVEGVDYFFVEPTQFDQMVREDDFLEHAQVFDHQYGTSRAQITTRLAQGIDILLDIDWQGAEAIKQVFPEAVTLFILPPSLDSLKERLQRRQQDDAAVIERRMQRARSELSHYDKFDYLIVNDVFEEAAQALSAIVTAERCRLKRQKIKHQKLLSFLLASQ